MPSIASTGTQSSTNFFFLIYSELHETHLPNRNAGLKRFVKHKWQVSSTACFLCIQNELSVNNQDKL